MTPEQMKERVDCIARDIVPNVLEPAARYANVLIGAIATSDHMKKARVSPRSSSDGGPLRIQTTRLARSLTGAEFHGAGKEAVSRMEVSGNSLTLTKGSKTPYAAVHEYGFSGDVKVPRHRRKAHMRNGVEVKEQTVRAHTRTMRITARPYLRPALEDARSKVREKIADLLVTHSKRCLSGVNG